MSQTSNNLVTVVSNISINAAISQSNEDPISLKSISDLKQSIEQFIKNYFTNASSDIITQCKASFPNVVFKTVEKNIISY